MYLEFISVKNISVIKELTINPNFTDKRNKNPLLSLEKMEEARLFCLLGLWIVFYEIGSKLFYNIDKQQNLARIFYKLGDRLNLKISLENDFAAIQYESQLLSKAIEHLDCIKCDKEGLKNQIQKIQN